MKRLTSARLGRTRLPISRLGSRTMYRNSAKLLGLELELQAQEAPVGPFSLDFAGPRNRNEPRGNHRKPAGADRSRPPRQAAYLRGGYEADGVVWLARGFRFQARIRPDTGCSMAQGRKVLPAFASVQGRRLFPNRHPGGVRATPGVHDLFSLARQQCGSWGSGIFPTLSR